MTRLITRNNVAAVLHKWQTGEWSAEDVHAWAESVYAHGDVDYQDWEPFEDDNQSATNEVAAALSFLDGNLILAEDIPIYLQFLAAAPGTFASAYRKFNEALSRIDYAARRKRLAQVELYARFCR